MAGTKTALRFPRLFVVSCPDRRSSLAQTVWPAKSNFLGLWAEQRAR